MPANNATLNATVNPKAVPRAEYFQLATIIGHSNSTGTQAVAGPLTSPQLFYHFLSWRHRYCRWVEHNGTQLQQKDRLRYWRHLSKLRKMYSCLIQNRSLLPELKRPQLRLLATGNAKIKNLSSTRCASPVSTHPC